MGVRAVIQSLLQGQGDTELGRLRHMARDSRMMVRRDAKAQGMVWSGTVRHTARWQGSKPSAHTSECISYTEDENGNKQNITIFRAKREHVARKVRKARDDRRANVLHLLELAGNNSDAD